MILSIGEILADIVVLENGSSALNIGGAPFNVAVNAKRNSSCVGFIGSVGKDVVGLTLINKAEEYLLDNLDIYKSDKNTTLAFVTLNNGERSFSFFRNDTADTDINYKSINIDSYANLNILHIGSLMLSCKKGRKALKNLILKAKKSNVLISFDVNLRDVFKSDKQLRKSYKYPLDSADIIKLSGEELTFFTGEEDLTMAINSLARKNALYLITLGEKGSFYFYNGKSVFIEAEKVEAVDTTGAGDAFFGTFLSEIEGKSFTEENIVSALKKANRKGAECTLKFGAL